MITEPNRKKKDSISFLARTQPMKSHGIFVYQSLPNLLFISVKALSFPCYAGFAYGLSWLQTLNCNSLLTPNKTVFAGEISGSLFVSSQQVDTKEHDCWIIQKEYVQFYKKLPNYLLKWLYHFALTPEMTESSCCSTFSSEFGVVSVLDFAHSTRCVVVSHLHMHVSDDL